MELIVVVAIMTVLAGGTISLLGIIPRRQTVGCAKKVVYYMEKTRTNSMSFQEANLLLYYNDNGVYARTYIKDTVTDENGKAAIRETYSPAEKIGEAGVILTHENDVLGTLEALPSTVDVQSVTASDAHVMVFSFNRATGGLEDVKQDGNTAPLTQFTVTKASHRRIIDIVKLTGRVEIIVP